MGNTHYLLNIDVIDLIINIETIQLRDLIKFLTISKFFHDIFLNQRYWQTISDSSKIIKIFIRHVMNNDGNCIFPIKYIKEIYETHNFDKEEFFSYRFDHYKYERHINHYRKIIYNFPNKIKERTVHLIYRYDVNKFYKLFENYRFIQISDESSSIVHGDTIYAYSRFQHTKSIQSGISMIIPDIKKIIKRSKRYQSHWYRKLHSHNKLYLSAILDPPFVINNTRIKNIVYYSSSALLFEDHDDDYLQFDDTIRDKLYFGLSDLPHNIVKLWMPFFHCKMTDMFILSSLPNLNFLAVGIKSSEWNNEIYTDITLDTLVLYITVVPTIEINLPNVKYIDINNKYLVNNDDDTWSQYNYKKCRYDKLVLYSQNAEIINFNRIQTIYCDVHINNCCKLYVCEVKRQIQIFSKCIQEIIVNKFIIEIERTKCSSEKLFIIDFEDNGTIKSYLIPTNYKLKIDPYF